MTNTPVLSAINIYPVKSCRGIALKTSHIDTWGLKYDRNWMVVNAEGGFLTQRKYPQMALIETELNPDALLLRAPNMPELRIPLSVQSGDKLDVTVWNDHCQAIDQGTEAADWLSNYMGLKCRLVRIRENHTRLADPHYTPQPTQVSFADDYPLMLISEASLTDLNARLAEPLPMNRFRPNLVVAGCEPYAEDKWRTMQIGEVMFEVVKPCARCAIINTNQTTSSRGKQPMVKLATYRRVRNKILFGQHLTHTGLGKVQLGDAVKVFKSQDSVFNS
jgi:hypothetical protein